MRNTDLLDKLSTGYNEFKAEDFIIGNKLKKQLNEDNLLNPEERAEIAKKLGEILSNYGDNVKKEAGKLTGLSNTFNERIRHAIKVEELKERNFEGYTENDKKIMLELKEKHPEKYEKLILDHKIEFTKNTIILSYIGKYEIDREDLKTSIVGKEEMTIKKAEDIAKKQGKVIFHRFHNLAENFGNKFIIDLFQLKNGDYHTNYISGITHNNLVQESRKFGKNVSVNTCGSSFSSGGWTSDTKEVDKNHKAYVRLAKKIKRPSSGGSHMIIG